MKQLLATLGMLVLAVGLSFGADLNQEVAVVHHPVSYNADGSIYQDYGVLTNLVTDVGLDMLGNTWMAQVSTYFHFGADNTKNGRYSDGTTVTITGSNAVSSASFFQDADTNGFGRVIDIPGVGHGRVISVVSGTEAVLDNDLTVTDSEFTIWHTDQTTLVDEFEVGNTYLSGASYNGVSCSTGTPFSVVRFARTGTTTGSYPSGATIGEIGISPDGGDLFARLSMSIPLTIPPGGSASDKVEALLFVDTGTRDATGSIDGLTIGMTNYNPHVDFEGYLGSWAPAPATLSGISTDGVTYLLTSYPGGQASGHVASSWAYEPAFDWVQAVCLYPLEIPANYAGRIDQLESPDGEMRAISRTPINTTYIPGTFKKVTQATFIGEDWTYPEKVRGFGMIHTGMQGWSPLPSYAYNYVAFEGDGLDFQDGQVLTVTFEKRWDRKY